MRLLLSLLLVSVLTGCASVIAHRDPKVDLGKFQRFFVERRLNDNHATDEIIAADLRARGYTASCGPITMMPEDTQVVIQYDARWNWEFRSYLIDLSITVRRAYAETILATGNYHNPGLTNKKSEAMVHTLLNDFFK